MMKTGRMKTKAVSGGFISKVPTIKAEGDRKACCTHLMLFLKGLNFSYFHFLLLLLVDQLQENHMSISVAVD